MSYMSMGEYREWRDKAVKWAIAQMVKDDVKTFTSKDFAERVKEFQRIFAITIRTPNYYECGRIGGGWDFTDFVERIHKALKPYVKSGMITKTKTKNRIIYTF